MRFSKIFLSAAVLASAIGISSTASGQSGDVQADYIVTFRSASAMASGVEVVKAAGGQVLHTYRHALNGIAVSLPTKAIRALSARAEVASIELDQVVTADATQTGATWGLDRIDQAALPLDGSYTYNYDGTYNSGASRVEAYIIDTGILPTHVEFGGRVSAGFSAIKDRRGSVDCNGHGTHVAGTVGGATYGVAKGVQLIPVRVLDCRGSGTNSGVIAGIDWAFANHAAGVPAVANMSLGGGFSATLNSAVANLVSDGIAVAVAAGNSNVDACNTSPASTPAVLTVGATTSTDARASYSNFGSCLDLFAPGSSITSAWYKSNTSTNTISGTSMASPHVAGVAALVWSADTSQSATTVMSKVVSSAKADKVTSAGTNSPNRLLYSIIS